jgi:hypothetical protein
MCCACVVYATTRVVVRWMFLLAWASLVFTAVGGFLLLCCCVPWFCCCQPCQIGWPCLCSRLGYVVRKCMRMLCSLPVCPTISQINCPFIIPSPPPPPPFPSPSPSPSPCLCSLALPQNYPIAVASWCLVVSECAGMVVAVFAGQWAFVFLTRVVGNEPIKLDSRSLRALQPLLMFGDVGCAVPGAKTHTSQCPCDHLLHVLLMVGVPAPGWLSDHVFGGRRAPVMAMFCLATVPVLLTLWPADPVGPVRSGPSSAALPTALAGALGGSPGPGSGLAPAASIAHLLLLFGALGAVTFAPHVLTSLCAREMSDPDVGSTAMGVVKAVGQVGGALAGSPVAYVVAAHGWYAVAQVLVACSAVSTAAYAVVR